MFFSSGILPRNMYVFYRLYYLLSNIHTGLQDKSGVFIQTKHEYLFPYQTEYFILVSNRITNRNHDVGCFIVIAGSVSGELY